MAVYCGICAERLYDATENYGSFRGTPELDGIYPGEIRDTCDQCCRALAEAVTRAANTISAKHRPAINKLRTEIQIQRDREEDHRKKEEEFRRAWELEQQK